MGGALTISFLGRRARSDAMTALALVAMLGLGALFVSRTTQYSAEVFALLFGQVLGVSTSELIPMAVLGAVCLAAVAVLYRPLLLSSAFPDLAPARGADPQTMTVVFGLLLALATTTSVPIVGALLMFALLVGPPAGARSIARRPAAAMGLSVVFALATIWSAIALAYATNLPIGFFVATIGAFWYLVGRVAARARRSARGRGAGGALSAVPPRG